MKLGRIYEFKDKNKKFPFDFERGCFIGYTLEGMPRFILNVRRGTQCFINADDSNFEEVDYEQERRQGHTPLTLKDVPPPQEANMI